MSTPDGAEFKVFAEKADRPNWYAAVCDYPWVKVGCGAGCLSAILLIILVPALGLDRIGAGTDQTKILGIGVTAAWILLFLASLFIGYVAYGLGERVRMRRTSEFLNRRAAEQAESVAHEALTGSIRTANDLPVLLSKAGELLETADAEFHDRAYVPFWNAIEQPAKCLEQYRDREARIADMSEKYHSVLDGTTHSFPEFSPSQEQVPDPLPVLKELKRLVREGQTDFEFANIWEHRRTREVMIAGFNTLEEGITHLGVAIEEVIWDFRESISSHISSVLDQQAELVDAVQETRDEFQEQTRLLDTIQRDKKPPI